MVTYCRLGLVYGDLTLDMQLRGFQVSDQLKYATAFATIASNYVVQGQREICCRYRGWNKYPD